MKTRNPLGRETPTEQDAQLRQLVRLLARQAAAEHVRTGLRDETRDR